MSNKRIERTALFGVLDVAKEDGDIYWQHIRPEDDMAHEALREIKWSEIMFGFPFLSRYLE
jgi:hypothetical protein